MINARRMMISALGGFAGVMGIEHGIGEVLQGSVRPEGLMILSWPGSAFFRALQGEPAMTVVPNLLVTGLLAILISALYTLWAVVWIEREHSGWVLMALCVPMLLVGGGIFPPILGLIIGAAATGLHAPLTWWRAHLSPGVRRILGGLWPWFFAACLLTWLAMFPGVPVLDYFFGVDYELLIWSILAGMFGFLILSGITGFARDVQTA